MAADTDTTQPLKVIADLEPDGSAFAWGWHDRDAFLREWDTTTEGDGLAGDEIDDRWRSEVHHWWACEVVDPTYPKEKRWAND